MIILIESCLSKASKNDENINENIKNNNNGMMSDEMKDMCTHLTNYSLNKQNPIFHARKKHINNNYNNNDDETLHSFKWSLNQLWNYLDKHEQEIFEQKNDNSIISCMFGT